MDFLKGFLTDDLSRKGKKNLLLFIAAMAAGGTPRDGKTLHFPIADHSEHYPSEDFAIDVEAEAKSYFAGIYAGRLAVEDLVTMLKRMSKSSVQRCAGIS